MTAQVPGLAERVFAQILTLQQQARAAKDIDSLAYALVNDAQGLFAFRHAALLIAGVFANQAIQPAFQSARQPEVRPVDREH